MVRTRHFIGSGTRSNSWKMLQSSAQDAIDARSRQISMAWWSNELRDPLKSVGAHIQDHMWWWYICACWKRAQIFRLLLGFGVTMLLQRSKLRILNEQRTRVPSMRTGWRCVRIQSVDADDSAQRLCGQSGRKIISAESCVSLELIRCTRQLPLTSFAINSV